MGKYLDIARKLEEQRTDSLGGHVENLGLDILDPVKSSERLDFIDHLDETTREYYLNLMEIMQSPKFALDKETAEQKAGAIITRHRQPLQIQQAVHDYKRYGYIKIFSTILGEAVYLAKDERSIKRVPDKNLPVFTEKDLMELDPKELGPEMVKSLLECKVLFGGCIMK